MFVLIRVFLLVIMYTWPLATVEVLVQSRYCAGPARGSSNNISRSQNALPREIMYGVESACIQQASYWDSLRVR